MPDTDAPCLLWFRQDLRLEDNPALAAAIASERPVVPVYIWDEAGDWSPGGASRWWLHHALEDLAKSLAGHGLRLALRTGDSAEELKRLIAETGAGAVYWNRCYEPAAIARDKAIKQALKDAGLEAESFNASLLFEPWEIQNKSGKPFQVFTPYWKRCREFPTPAVAKVPLGKLAVPATWPDSEALEELGLLPEIKWDAGFYEAWTPTRRAGLQRLTAFAKEAVSAYGSQRDRPDVDGTSRLSPYLHFGQIGPREVFAAFREKGSDDSVGGRKYLAEIGWREFSYHLLYHFPETPERALREQFADFPWRKNRRHLQAWQRGQTGYPIVDAGMRQLWATGWMHNRVRMIAASLLVKHLLQPWQAGAEWFWDTLVDADLASNTQGWQWTAGCGADAAPYFRVFNPITQGEKFDPEGEYVRQWVPELKRLPDKYLHKPWEAPENLLAACGVELGDSYPEPIVGHFEGRSRALAAFEELKKQSGKS